MADSQLSYEQLVSEYNRQHLLIFTQNAYIQQLEEKVAVAENREETLHKDIRKAKQILEDQEEVIRQLDVEINQLLNKIEQYQEPEPINKS